MTLYLTALAFALFFAVGGLWACWRLYHANAPQIAPEGVQRGQVAIYIDAEGEFIEGECSHA